MADTYDVYGSTNGTSWNTLLNDHLGFGKDQTSPLGAIPQDTFQGASTLTNSLMDTNNGNLQNTKYVSTTTVSLNEAAAVDLTTITQFSNTTRWHFLADGGVDSILSNVVFFAYNGTDPDTAPSNCLFVAYEWISVGDVNTNRTGGDAAGKAWDSSYGIGGRANGLACDGQSKAGNHYFYIGISGKPTGRGKTILAFRLEFDVT